MDNETDFHDGPGESGSIVVCAVCEQEVPLSEAVVSEASDYMAYFCGLECYDRWRKRAAIS